jgi:hypothetical protein
MKKICLYFLLLFAGRLCVGQTECADLNKQRAPTEDSSALDRIINRVGFSPGTIQLFVSSDQSVQDRGGAMSLTCVLGSGVERWIVYDPELVKPPSRDFVFAHEVAHHVNSQLISGKPWTKGDELQADYNGAQYLVGLCWTEDQLLQALNQLNLGQGQGYPTLEERRAKIAKAYSDWKSTISCGSPDKKIASALERVINGRGQLVTRIHSEGYPDKFRTNTLQFFSFKDCILKFSDTWSFPGGKQGGETYSISLSLVQVTTEQGGHALHIAGPDDLSIKYVFFGLSGSSNETFTTKAYDLFIVNTAQTQSFLAAFTDGTDACNK